MMSGRSRGPWSGATAVIPTRSTAVYLGWCQGSSENSVVAYRSRAEYFHSYLRQALPWGLVSAGGWHPFTAEGDGTCTSWKRT
jgi:hypothetical protein